ncbi:MAG: 2-amino-4-hydroxy-6-hydroxymethyldihydropteridine diphosphokinase [Anaerolineae bacterium]|jgi:2-amino-4-hydroxy-6-hydroxymethyldihydropteridine diphosphokinase|nr:2-amino-4-hydroxy-6-hydroxymethyldihydropteridine diphosphokinase [Anaerolineae bacterium]
MTDRIHIKDLRLRTVVGINKEERENRQDVLINITLDADTRAAGVSDEIGDAVNYRTITKRVIRMVEASRFFLVERLAAEIAAICLADPRVAAARVTLEKPGALRYARSVGVEIARSRADIDAAPNRVYISMGSNIDPEKNLRAAVRLLAANDQVEVVATSPVYETAPVGKADQADFLNAALLVRTTLGAEALKAGPLHAIEQALGRARTADKNAPRTIDLDIALFNYAVLDIGVRHIPDPELVTRAHIAVPLADLAPYYVHPETGETLEEIAARLPKVGIARRIERLA